MDVDETTPLKPGSGATAVSDSLSKQDQDTADDDAANASAPRGTSHRLRWLILISILVLGYLWYHRGRSPSSSDPEPPHLPPPIFHHLGQYSPYFPVEQYAPPPPGCSVEQVSILMRHGARYPTSGAAKTIRHTVGKLKNASFKQGSSPEMDFLKDYRYNLKEEDLVPLGVQEAQQAAEEAYSRYGDLAVRKGVFMRSSSSDRVQRTAQEWRKAFLEASDGSVAIAEPLVISDAPGSNDTLANNGCPNHRTLYKHLEWASHFTPPIIARLSSQLPGVSLSSKDIIVLFSLCAFESVAYQSPSPFCHLFTEEEFLDYEYYQDLEKYYNRGYGNELGPVEGVGYVNELLARLTGKKVEDGTQTNRTLNENPATFPLDKGVYTDFSHDNTIAAIVSALGLFHDSSPLPTTHRLPGRAWKGGHTFPFGGRVVFERLDCSGVPSIRILGNDAVLPLPFCAEENEETGTMCTLKHFVKSQKFAREDGQELWKQCGWRPAGEGEECTIRHDTMPD